MDRYDFKYVGEYKTMEAVKMPDGVFVKHQDHISEILRLADLLRGQKLMTASQGIEIERLKGELKERDHVIETMNKANLKGCHHG